MKKLALSAALALALSVGAAVAQAQVVPTTCPSATVFYANGFSLTQCVPSYPPGYPNITVYPGNQYQNGYYYNAPQGSYVGGNGAFVGVQTNPFTPPVYSNNGLFAPAPTITGPTYYYPPAPSYPSGYLYGSPFWNVPRYCDGCGYHGGGHSTYYYDSGSGTWGRD